MRTPVCLFAVVSLALTVALASPVMPPSAAGEPGGPEEALKVVVFGGYPDHPGAG